MCPNYCKKKNNGATIIFNLPKNSTCLASFEPVKPIPAANAPTIRIQSYTSGNSCNPNAEPNATPCLVALTYV